jgi:CDP-diacylglycerol--serine O-phosphatidyltransferase
VSILQGNINIVPTLVIICLFADFFDGMIARLLNIHSEIGKQLDSLADMVSFGVVPSIILYTFLGETGFSNPIALLPFAVVLFSALRLAKFNINEAQSKEFLGLATPASTAFVVGLLMASLYQDFTVSAPMVIATSLVLPVLLIINFPMFSLKVKGFSLKEAGWQYAFLVLAILSLIIFKYLGICIGIIVYILMNLIRFFLTKK